MSSIVAASDSGKYAPMSENDKKLIDMIIKVNCQVHPSLATQYDRDEDDNPIIESASEGFQFLCEILTEMNERVSILAMQKAESENPALEDGEVDSKAVIEAVRELYDGELTRHAVSEITKALNKFQSSSYSCTSVNDERFDKVHIHCGLQFHPKLFAQLFKQSVVDKECSVTGAIALACLCEYTCAECAELSGNIKQNPDRAKEDFEKREENSDHDRTDYSANMVRKAIENDAELLKTFSGIAYIGTDDNAYSSEEEVFST